MHDDANDMEKVVCITFLKWFTLWCGKELYLAHKQSEKKINYEETWGQKTDVHRFLTYEQRYTR